MACLLYLVSILLRHGQDAYPYDTQVFCVLMAIEIPNYLRAWMLRRR